MFSKAPVKATGDLFQGLRRQGASLALGGCSCCGFGKFSRAKRSAAGSADWRVASGDIASKGARPYCPWRPVRDRLASGRVDRRRALSGVVGWCLTGREGIDVGCGIRQRRDSVAQQGCRGAFPPDPGGMYARCIFESQFGSAVCREIESFRLDEDRQWRFAGYHLQ